VTSTRNDETAMRSALSLFVLMAVLLIATSGAAPPSETAAPDTARDDALASNARRLERWRKDPEHHARLQRDLNAFWEMSPERRAQLRKLDQDLHQEDSATQTRLWGVLERYHSWLERLPQEDRRRVQSTDDWRKRLEVVRDLREQEWVRRQPPAVQKRIKGLPAGERRVEVTRLRDEQRQRQREAMRRDKPPGNKPRTALPEVPERTLYHFLMNELTREDRKRLNFAPGDPDALARVKQEFFKRHPRELRRLQQLDRKRNPVPKDRAD
jgi:hypothetical protein